MTTCTAVDPHFPVGGIRGEFLLKSNGRRMTTLAPFVFTDGDTRIIVPEFFTTDFNSVPRVLWLWFPPWECPEAAIIHDWLYRNPGPLFRDEVDALHRRVMDVQGERLTKRWLVWAGIRVGGWLTWARYRMLNPALPR